ncbi:MAG TPA: hypothetical protein VJG65_03755, partial [Patescibacteria group bacterium]|nr:hypothetical protein [Patescibacteria group bacterium]
MVLFNLVITLVAPAVSSPVPIQLPDFKISRAQIEELIFKISGAQTAKAIGSVEEFVAGGLGLEEFENPGGVAAVAPASAGGGLPVKDIGGNILQMLGIALMKLFDSLGVLRDEAVQGLKDAVFTAANESLRNFLNTMAYDTATWLASGDKGQKPLFYTEGWGEYLKDLADGAAGNFVERLGGNWLNLNVCNPSSPNLKRQIGLGLAKIKRPRQPDCSVTEMIHNWDEAIDDPDFLPKFSEIFDPYRNDIGIAFSIFDQYYAEQQKAVQDGTKDREAGGGWKAVTDAISGLIKTPAKLVAEKGYSALVKEAPEEAKRRVQFGPILSDAIGIFMETLTGKLFEKIFKQGLVSAKDEGFDQASLANFGLGFLRDFLRDRENQDLYSETALSGIAAKNASQIRFLDFLQAGKREAQPYDILSRLALCSDPKNPGPEECVISPAWRTAIERKLTLRQAIDQGFIDGNSPFGFYDYNADAIYRGLPYRSIVILRTHRIAPATWEIAAQAIK